MNKTMNPSWLHKLIFLLTGSMIIVLSGFALSRFIADFDIIRDRIIENILNDPIDDDHIKDILDQISSGGSWPYIDYVDTSRTGFQHAEHLQNMNLMARAFMKEDSRYFHSPEVKTALSASLDYWLAYDFICENWWWNQIGTPRYLVNVLLLMENDLSKEQVNKSVKIIDRANLNASGARPSGDRIKIAGILAKKLLVTGDKDQFDQVIKVIEGEIKFSQGRGMQVDYSFHHRLDRVNNTLSYGLGYAQAFAEWAAYVAHTQYEFSQPSIHQLVDYFLDGICKMMIYGKYPDPGAKNRSLSRKRTLHAHGVEMVDDLLKATDYRESELRAIREIRLGRESDHRKFNKFFWQSEYMSHQRPGYFTSARMYSTRNQNMEYPYNSEGLKNHYLGDGANFISRTGQEYYNIFPVLDWRRIPGTTVVQKPTMPSEKEVRVEGVTEFVGGVSDGLCGAATFDYIKVRDSLQAHKSWFFFDDVLVCLGAGITSSSVFPVNTTLNQALLKGKVLVANSKLTYPVHNHLETTEEDINWVWHDSVGYVFPSPQNVRISNATQSGSWFDINRQSDSPQERVQRDIFKLWLDHGRQPARAGYAYMVIPAVSLTAIENRDYNDRLKILSNTERLQAVQHRLQGMVQAVFYEAGTLQISPDLIIEMEDPGMVMVNYRNGKVLSLAVSDPARKLEEMHFSVSQKLEMETMDDDVDLQWDSSEKETDIEVSLPQDEQAGRSVVLSF